MPRCTRSIAADCDDNDLRPVLLFMRREPRLICARCRAALERAGASFSVVEAEPVRPSWLRNLKGRDETGRLVA